MSSDDRPVSIAVVTGAARGGGQGIALALARTAQVLVLVSRSTRAQPNRRLSGTLEETADAVRQSGAEPVCLAADLSRPEECARVVEHVIRHYGGCDVLVNNAAYNPIGSFPESTPGKWMNAIAVNLNAAALLSLGLLPAMRERGWGRIVNIGSAAAVTDFFPQLAYAASKAGLERFTTGLASEMMDSGITVNCIRIDEALKSEALLALVAPDSESLAEGCTPAEFGAAVAWVAAQPADFTGKILTFAALRAHGALPPLHKTVLKPD